MSKIFFYTGAMNCGKTNAVIQTAYNYREEGQRPLVIRPAVDTREENKHVLVSRSGSKWDDCVILPKDESEMNAFVSDILENWFDAIIIDEVQFLTVKQIERLAAMAKALDIPMMCYGLRNNFKGGGFPASDWLMRNAKVTTMKSICWCGAAATHNMMLIDGVPYQQELHGDIDAVTIGGNETYQGVCFNHFRERHYEKPENRPKRFISLKIAVADDALDDDGRLKQGALRDIHTFVSESLKTQVLDPGKTSHETYISVPVNEGWVDEFIKAHGSPELQAMREKTKQEEQGIAFTGMWSFDPAVCKKMAKDVLARRMPIDADKLNGVSINPRLLRSLIPEGKVKWDDLITPPRRPVESSPHGPTIDIPMKSACVARTVLTQVEPGAFEESSVPIGHRVQYTTDLKLTAEDLIPTVPDITKPNPNPTLLKAELYSSPEDYVMHALVKNYLYGKLAETDNSYTSIVRTSDEVINQTVPMLRSTTGNEDFRWTLEMAYACTGLFGQIDVFLVNNPERLNFEASDRYVQDITGINKLTYEVMKKLYLPNKDKGFFKIPDGASKHETAVRVMRGFRTTNDLIYLSYHEAYPEIPVPDEASVIEFCLKKTRAWLGYPEFEWTSDMEQEYQKEKADLSARISMMHIQHPGMFNGDGTINIMALTDGSVKSYKRFIERIKEQGEDNETEI